jgi:hypothetical protein
MAGSLIQQRHDGSREISRPIGAGDMRPSSGR